MNRLTASYSRVYSQAQTPLSLKYLSGKGSVDFKFFDNNTLTCELERNGSPISISVDRVELLTDALLSGEPIHVDSVFGAGGNTRTVIETLVAQVPEVGWRMIGRKKHLQAFNYEVHSALTTLNLDSDLWTNPEWALGALFYEWNRDSAASLVSKEELARRLETCTRKTADSWKMRVSNIESAVTGRPFNGGVATADKASYWAQRLTNDLTGVRTLAVNAFLSTGDQKARHLVCEEFGIPLVGGAISIVPSPLYRALVSKPLAIIIGNSGTGKTREAETLAMMFRNADDVAYATNIATVAVGADWMDNRNVLGFVNHLRQLKFSDVTRPAFQSTHILDLLIHARDHPSEPHFLVLDEMNLSHVERYFADFLSAMESADGRLRLHSEGHGQDPTHCLPRFDGDSIGVPRSLNYPPNLFVIGTVNVDESTYMFSPKVLDRAHVLEFTVDRAALEHFLTQPHRPEPVARVPSSEATRFLELSRRARSLCGEPLPPLPVSVNDQISAHLLNLFDILKHGRFEFAFRASLEVMTYLAVCQELSSDKSAWEVTDWERDLDAAIVQKLLPRIHGSRTRIGSQVAGLTAYCHGADIEFAKRFIPNVGMESAEKPLADVLELDDTDARFPLSARKLREMVIVLLQEQFASFIC